MADAVDAAFSEPHLRDVFQFFIKYVGSSALAAPGYMNLMPHIQFEYDLWYVDGGMYNLARGLRRLADELGVRFHFNAKVARIATDGRREGVLAAAGLLRAMPVTSPGRSSSSTGRPLARRTSRSTTFFSSRIFPGQR